MKEFKKGVALLWVLLLSVVLLIITGSMVTMITKESRASVRTENSVQAYLAAKSGVDWYINEKKKVGFLSPLSCDSGSTRIDIDGSDVWAEVCTLPAERIQSIGYAGKSMRSIEYKSTTATYTNVPLANIPAGTGLGLGTGIAAGKSFELIVRFYPVTNTPATFFMGLTDTNNSSSSIGVGIYNHVVSPNYTFKIGKKSGGTTSISPSGVPFPSGIDVSGQLNGGSSLSQRGAITAKLKYVNGEYVSVIYEGNYREAGLCKATAYYTSTSLPTNTPFNYFSIASLPGTLNSDGNLVVSTNRIVIMAIGYREI